MSLHSDPGNISVLVSLMPVTYDLISTFLWFSPCIIPSHVIFHQYPTETCLWDISCWKHIQQPAFLDFLISEIGPTLTSSLIPDMWDIASCDILYVSHNGVISVVCLMKLFTFGLFWPGGDFPSNIWWAIWHKCQPLCQQIQFSTNIFFGPTPRIPCLTLHSIYYWKIMRNYSK